MLSTCSKLRLGRLDRLGWCRAGALGAPLAQSLPRRETTAVCFCPGTYPIWALKILINMWYNRNMNMSHICQICNYRGTYSSFLHYIQSHTNMSVSMLSSLTHPPSKSTLLHVVHLSILRFTTCRCNPRGSRGQNVVLHHRHSAPHVLLNAFQGLSSKRFEKGKPNRKKPIDLIWSFLIPGLICPSFLDKTLTDKSWYGSGRWHFSPSGLFAISIMELTVNFRNGLQHARAIRFLRRTLFATYFRNISWHSLWHMGSSHVQTILYPPTFAICCSCRA